jgi:hypothetical protein
MIQVENHTVKYFKAIKGYFWQWSEKGNVIEWQDGESICYRDDLVDLLQQVNNKSLPPLSTLLLLISACRRPQSGKQLSFLYIVLSSFKSELRPDEYEELNRIFEEAVIVLKNISALPENLRTGQKRIHLINELFPGGKFNIARQELNHLLQELATGRFDKDVADFYSAGITVKEFSSQLEYFSEAYKKYPTLASLTTKLRTGLSYLPEPIPVELTPLSSLSIFDQLLQDPKTAGIARLAKRLVATLNIPMHNQDSSDQRIGGISDITNRGHYDKLLLSELAYDDDLLMARLVNNEALYFRREQPPKHPKLQRIILMDATLKMWGTSRVFAVAAGLAGAQNNKHSVLLQSYSLGGSNFIAVNLNTTSGVIQALENLDHALHCGSSLESVIDLVGDDQNMRSFL